jgi:hypothetical protein
MGLFYPFVIMAVVLISTGAGVLGGWYLHEHRSAFFNDCWEHEHPLDADFLNYLEDHPQYRFWQALANWSHHHIIAYPVNKSPTDLLVIPELNDTWEWKGRFGLNEGNEPVAFRRVEPQ